MTRPPRRLGSLDGLRAIAVAAVVVYHIDDRVLPGGFLGVDVFFVLSGYLITTLLVSEHRRSGGIALREFWKRRARRLWAAAWVVLAAVGLLGLWNVWGADRQALLAGDIFAAVAHIENYWLLGHGGYLGQYAAPSPVRHFWSLAVEEQFYLVWPLVMIGGLLAVRRFGRTAMWILLGGLGAISLTVGLLVTPERAYLGTVPRAIALIVGAALAWWWSSTPLAAPRCGPLRRAVAVWAGLGTVVLVVGLFTLSPNDAVLARGGFLTVAVASAGVTGLAVIPGPTARWLAAPMLVWIGRRSYGIYLIHWPLIVAMGPGRPSWLVALVVIPMTIAIAAALHALVEVPLIERRWKPSMLYLGTASLAFVICLSLLVALPQTTPTQEVADSLERVADPGVAPNGTSGSGSGRSTTTTTICIPTVVAGAVQERSGVTSGFDPDTVTELDDPSTEACAEQIDVLVVGDSTGRGFSNGLVGLGDPNLRVWDRTELGCSLGGEECADWRTTWAAAVAEVDPDLVVLYANPVIDLKGVDDADFESDAGEIQRTLALVEASEVLTDSGAALLLVTPPAPRAPEGLFFCDGRRSGTGCDPDVVEAWGETVDKVAEETGASVLDVAGFLESIGDSKATRPDGMHFAGGSLHELATWARPVLALAIVAKANG
ncbi:MAG: acyltransferase family protein [Microthrixaceae bacterium]